MASTFTLPPDAEARVNMLKEHLQAFRQKQATAPAPTGCGGSTPSGSTPATSRKND